jgi:hypothetical protein
MIEETVVLVPSRCCALTCEVLQQRWQHELGRSSTSRAKMWDAFRKPDDAFSVKPSSAKLLRLLVSLIVWCWAAKALKPQ